MSHLVLLIYAAPLLVIWLCLRIMGIGTFRFLKRRLRPASQEIAPPTTSSRRKRSPSRSSGGALPSSAGKGIAGALVDSTARLRPLGLASGSAMTGDRAGESIRSGLMTRIAEERQEADRLRGEQRLVQEDIARLRENNRIQEEHRLRQELEDAEAERRREEERLEEERRQGY